MHFYVTFKTKSPAQLLNGTSIKFVILFKFSSLEVAN